MGQESSRFVDQARAAASKLARDFGPETDSESSILWEGVSDNLRWLVVSQVRALLSLDAEVLLYRPEQLELDSADVAAELGAHETQLAAAALRDKMLGPKLQRAREALVPNKLSEPAFWDHFFSHLDIIKVKIVSDYLRAQEMTAEAQKRKHAAWLATYDRCDARMQADLKRAAEHICAQRPPAQASAAETAIGFNPLSLARWTAGRSEAWLDYTEDGPWEIARLLRKKVLRRAGAGAQAPAVRGQGGDRGEGEGAAAAAGRYSNLDCAHALAPGLSSGMPAVGEAAPALSPPLAAPQPMSPPHSTPIHARMLPKTPRFELSSPDFSSPSDSTPGLPSAGKPTPDASPASPAAPPFAAGPTAATLVPNLMD